MLRAWSVFVVILAGCSGSRAVSEPASVPAGASLTKAVETFVDGDLEVAGKSLPAPGRVSEIAAPVMHPVLRVLVKPGDRVKAGQPLVEMDSDEPADEVRAKQAEVEELRAALARLKALPRAEERAEASAEYDSAQIASRAAKELLDHLHALHKSDAVSHRECIDQKTALHRAEADERAAKAQLDCLLKQPVELEIAEAEAKLKGAEAQLSAAQHELEHYTVHAAIDGIVSWLDVTPGTVTRAGTKTWGEIVDLREVDVRVELTPKQLSLIDTTQPAVVRQAELGKSWPAKFIFSAPSASPETGRIPVILRVTSVEENLPCQVAVTVRLKPRSDLASAKAAALPQVADTGR